MSKSFLACALVMAATPVLAQHPTQPDLLKVEPKFAITKSISPVKANGPLELEVVTVTKSPLFLKPGRLKTPSGKYVVTPSGAAPSVPGTAGQDVRQRWSWKVEPAEKGKFTAVFGVGVSGSGIPNSNTWVTEFTIK